MADPIYMNRAVTPTQAIPEVPLTIDNDTGKILSATRDVLLNGQGKRGDPMDTWVTFRDLKAVGAIVVYPSGTAVRNGVPVFTPPDSVTSAQDLTAPPAPTALTAIPAFQNVILTASYPAAYLKGRGLEFWASPTNDRATATLVTTEVPFNGTSLYSHPIGLGLTRYYWARLVSKADVRGDWFPANPLAGIAATTGQIGNSDLGPLIITADKISAGNYEGLNLVKNPGAEDGVVAWGLVEAAAGSGILTADVGDKTGGSKSFRITKVLTTDGVAYGSTAFPVIPGETYSVKLRLRASTASAAGLYLRANEIASYPVGGYVTASLRSSYTDFISNVPMPFIWTPYEFTYVVPVGVFWVSFSVYNWTTSTALNLYFDDVLVGRQISASSIAAGSIAVGSAAIANGAIRNALIENLAVDNAKIALLAVSTANLQDAAITTAKIGTAQITDAKILNLDGTKINANSITTQQLTVGATNTPNNLLENSDWTEDVGVRNSPLSLRGWTVYTDLTNVAATSGYRNYSNGAVVNVGRGGMFIINNGAGTGSFAIANSIEQVVPAVVGVTYEASVYARADRAQMYLFVRCLDSALVTLAQVVIEPAVAAGSGYGGNDGPSSMVRLWTTITAPANTAFINFSIGKRFTQSGQSASSMCAHRAMLCIAPIGVTALTATPWNNSAAVTQINGSSIVTNSITAQQLTVAALSNTVNGNAVSGGRIEIANNVIRIYDETNALRVKMGYLL
jgi:hypothetical protein